MLLCDLFMANVSHKTEVVCDKFINFPSVPSFISGLEAKPTEMSYVTILMNRGKTGYGFSVTGGKPAVVARIEKGKPIRDRHCVCSLVTF